MWDCSCPFIASDRLRIERGFAEKLEVSQVFWAANSALVAHERLAVNPPYPKSFPFIRDAMSPEMGFVDSADGGCYVDSMGRHAQLNHLARLKEVSLCEAQTAEPKITKRSDHALGILRTSADHKVQVVGKSRTPMVATA